MSARVVAYTGVWLILVCSVAVLLAGRRDLDVLILRQPGTLYTTVTGGDVANFYSVQALNRTGRTRAFTIDVVEPRGATVTALGQLGEVAAYGLAESRVMLRIRPAASPEPARRSGSPCARMTAWCRQSNRRSSVPDSSKWRQTRGRHRERHEMRITLNWGTGIALVYTAFAAATTGFVTFAMSRSVDLVSADYYAQSLQQDQRMDAERNTAALASPPEVVQSGARALVLSLPSAHAASATGTVTLYRPSDASADRVLPLAVDADGRQQIALDGLARGRWLLQVRWSAGGRDYYFEEPVIVP